MPSQTEIGPPETRQFLPAKKPDTKFPLIDNDPHLFRTMRYTRTRDWIEGAAFAALPPSLLFLMERASPSQVGRGGFAPIMRLNIFIGLAGGFILTYCRSTYRFYGVTENSREVAMDMREMTDRVKAGEPLYGKSRLTPYMQGVATRNSRYTGIMMHVFPNFNIVNHPHHGVDTAKYYQNAERELEAERTGRK